MTLFASIFKKRSKAVPVHTIKIYRKSKGITPFILTLKLHALKWLTSYPGQYTHEKSAPSPQEAGQTAEKRKLAHCK